MNGSKQNTAQAGRGELLVPNPKLRLREQLREVMRFKHYWVRTEETYWQWIRQFIAFCREHPHLTPGLSPPSEGAERESSWYHPGRLGAAEVHQFLTYLAAERNVAVSTQNQALHPVR